ncbi:MAG: hypothetical protein DWQ04_15915 [Chloroflexi bacterium]|nr:MAG: hypothetical protein DWQ04_15915 [Chloroflexota bacterium]
MNFEAWLIAQQNREDLIGDLARILIMQNIEQKSSRRKPDEHKTWVDTVIRIAKPEYINVFNEAWQEFLLAKQAGIDSLNVTQHLE